MLHVHIYTLYTTRVNLAFTRDLVYGSMMNNKRKNVCIITGCQRIFGQVDTPAAALGLPGSAAGLRGGDLRQHLQRTDRRTHGGKETAVPCTGLRIWILRF